MIRSAFDKFRWAFFFILIDFRIQGFDVLPDIVGYLMLSGGLALLAAHSPRFAQARSLSNAMILLSVFSLFEPQSQGGGIHFGAFGPLGFVIGIVAMVVSLLMVYHLFGGIGELASRLGRNDLAAEADLRWRQYLMLAIAVLAGIVLIVMPFIAIVYVVALLAAAIALTVAIMRFMGRCGELLGEA